MPVQLHERCAVYMVVESMVDVDRQQLCDILEHGEGWRRVMGVVPRSRQDRTNKYSADQV